MIKEIKKAYIGSKFVLYAIRTDKDNLPFIEEIIMEKRYNPDGQERLYSSEKVDSYNNLYPFDRLRSDQCVNLKSVSDHCGTAYIFNEYNIAIDRIKGIMEKKVLKLKEDKDYLSLFESRINNLISEG